jgi:hypothetical protein
VNMCEKKQAEDSGCCHSEKFEKDPSVGEKMGFSKFLFLDKNAVI